MSLHRFLKVALVIFFLGIGVLYAGVNRVPFRQAEPDAHHKKGHSTLIDKGGAKECALQTSR